MNATLHIRLSFKAILILNNNENVHRADGIESIEAVAVNWFHVYVLCTRSREPMRVACIVPIVSYMILGEI